jgi:hypothetical protein
MSYDYDFEMIKRAYAEMARRAREKEKERSPASRREVEDGTVRPRLDLRDANETHVDAAEAAR